MTIEFLIPPPIHGKCSLDWIKKSHTIGLGPWDSEIIHWSAKELKDKSLLLRMDYKDYMGSDEALYRTLERLDQVGLVILKNVPITNEEEVRNVVERISLIRNSFYGLTWNVKSIAGSKNIAYTALELGLHMDLMYVNNCEEG
jgi:gamma-butyrobetaine dioxygenase